MIVCRSSSTISKISAVKILIERSQAARLSDGSGMYRIVIVSWLCSVSFFVLGFLLSVCNFTRIADVLWLTRRFKNSAPLHPEPRKMERRSGENYLALGRRSLFSDHTTPSGPQTCGLLAVNIRSANKNRLS